MFCDINCTFVLNNKKMHGTCIKIKKKYQCMIPKNVHNQHS